MLSHNFWNKYFAVYDVLNFVPPYRDLLSRIVEIAEVKEGEHVLDAGVGTGNLACLIRERGGEVVGVDFSSEAIAKYKSKDPDAHVIQLDLTQKLPFRDGEFDKVLSNNVLYSISREQRAPIFKELFRILKPGGKIVLSNIHKGFSPVKIYIEAVETSVKNEGLLKTIVLLTKLVIPTIKMFYYNFLIKKAYSFDSKNLFDLLEQKNELIRAGFDVTKETELVYAKQGILDTGTKMLQ